MNNGLLNNIPNGAKNASVLNIADRQKKNAPIFARGDMVSAVIMGKSDGKVNLSAAGGRFSFEAPADTVTGEIGETVSFEVISQTKSGLNLKQIHQQRQLSHETAKRSGFANLKELMEQSEFTEKDINVLDYESIAERDGEKKAMERQALAQIRRQVNSVVRSAGRTAVKALLAAGIDVNKIELGMLSGMVTEISKNSEIVVENNGLDEQETLSGREEELLAAAGYPASRRSAAALRDVAAKLAEIKKIALPGILGLLKSGEDLTVGNVYRFASLKSAPKTEDNGADVSQKETDKLFKREGIAPESENYYAARLFIRENISVTKENIDRYAFLTSLSEIKDEEILLKAIKAMKSGMTALSAVMDAPEIPVLSPEEYDRMHYEINIIKAEHIKLALLNREPMSVSRLAAIAAAVPETAVPEVSAADFVKARRELAEIGLKLTYEAANSLYAKNIRIDVVTLTEAVNALRTAERENHAAVLRAMGAPDSAENTEKLTETMETVMELRGISDKTYGDVITERIAFTARSLRQNQANHPTGEYAASAYARFESSPRLKYGDSFAKVAGQYSGLLESMGIEPTNPNIKAAKILTVNNMDVNYDNILSVKAVDAKITDLHSRLHPMIAAQMIKDGFNPLDMHVDDVLSYIETFDGQYGETPAELIAGHIYEMQKSKTLDSDDREALIAVYRMLGNIQKGGAAGVGAAVKSGDPLTLGRLLELSETLTDSVDIHAGDSISLAARPENSIKAIFERRAKNYGVDAEYYGVRVAEGLARASHPAALSEILNANGGAKDISAETLLERLAEANGNNDRQAYPGGRISRLLSEAAALEDVPAASIKALQDSGIPATIANIDGYRRMTEGQDFGSKLSKVEKNVKLRRLTGEMIAETDLSKIKDGDADRYTEEIYTAFKNAADGGEDLESVNEAMRALRLRYTLTKGQGGYYMPVKFNGGIADVNIYVMNDSLGDMEDISMSVLLRSEAGEINAVIRLKGNEADASITVGGVDYSRELAEYFLTDGIKKDTADENAEFYGKLRDGRLPDRLMDLAAVTLRFAENAEQAIINGRSRFARDEWKEQE